MTKGRLHQCSMRNGSAASSEEVLVFPFKFFDIILWKRFVQRFFKTMSASSAPLPSSPERDIGSFRVPEGFQGRSFITVVSPFPSASHCQNVDASFSPARVLSVLVFLKGGGKCQYHGDRCYALFCDGVWVGG